MKKICVISALLLLLSGCGTAEVYETVADEMVQPVMAEPRGMWAELPEDSVLPAMESENGTLYLCGDYEVMLQTFSSGDLGATVQAVSGFELDELTVIQTEKDGMDQYEFVWTTAGELGQRIGRATILDDGNYHYVISAAIDSDLIAEYQEVWNGIFESFRLT